MILKETGSYRTIITTWRFDRYEEEPVPEEGMPRARKRQRDEKVVIFRRCVFTHFCPEPIDPLSLSQNFVHAIIQTAKEYLQDKKTTFFVRLGDFFMDPIRGYAFSLYYYYSSDKTIVSTLKTQKWYGENFS